MSTTRKMGPGVWIAGVVLLATVIGWTCLVLLTQKRREAERAWQIRSEEGNGLRAKAAAFDPEKWRGRKEQLALRQQQQAKMTKQTAVDGDGSPLETYLEIVRFLEGGRRFADEQGVRLRPGEMFGFGSAVAQIPSSVQSGSLSEQLQLAEVVTNAIFLSGAESLLGIWRTEEKVRGTAAAPKAIDSAELFVWEMPALETSAGTGNSRAIKAQFAGGTSVLQRTLNALSAAPIGAVVRSVSAEPMTEQRGRSAKMEEGSADAILPRTVSLKFTIIVESVSGLGGSSRTVAWAETENAAEHGVTNLSLFGFLREGHRKPIRGDGGKAVDATPATPVTRGLVLESVERAPYPLQLSGYFGERGNYVVSLSGSDVWESILVRVGQSIPRWNCELVDFSVTPSSESQPPDSAGTEVIARARLREHATGRFVTLSSHELALSEEVFLARLAGADASLAMGARGVGERFEAMGERYRIDRIELDPVRVLVSRLSVSDDVLQSQVLTPRRDERPMFEPATVAAGAVETDRGVSLSHESAH